MHNCTCVFGYAVANRHDVLPFCHPKTSFTQFVLHPLLRNLMRQWWSSGTPWFRDARDSSISVQSTVLGSGNSHGVLSPRDEFCFVLVLTPIGIGGANP
jgi:hypothetical protein